MQIHDGGRAYVHIPLVYATHLHAQHELYGAALVRFPRLVGVDLPNLEVNDGVVVSFDRAGYDLFKIRALRAICTNTAVGYRLAREIVDLLSALPAACVAAETEHLGHRHVAPRYLTRLRLALVRAISVNLANPFVEVGLALAARSGENGDLSSQLMLQVLDPPSFSHLAFFSQELSALTGAEPISDVPRRLVQFCWDCGFLASSTGDGSLYEDPTWLGHELGMSRAALRDLPGPTIGIPKALEPTQSWAGVRADNAVERLVGLLRGLQTLEEVRHYWQLRSMRLLRLMNGPSESSWADHARV